MASADERRGGPEPVHVLVAPDKFKGSLTAAVARREIGAGLEAAPERLRQVGLPVADGGEGTTAALLEARGGELLERVVADPLGRPVAAELALLGTGAAAIVEVAAASGLNRLALGEHDPELASSHGTGELIAAAIDAGAETVLVAAGGSATSDGGRGALEALGASFGDGPRPRLSALAEVAAKARIVVLCDVDIPLVGPVGAARAFGPQKGADEAAVARLEQRLERWGELAATATGRDPRPLPNAGAAGGLAGGLWAFLGAQLCPGASYVLDAVGFARRVAWADVVVTGEGRIDFQTLRGKIVAEISARCRAAGTPCFALVGADDLPRDAGLDLEVRVVAPGRIASAADLRNRASTLGAELLVATAKSVG